MTTPSGDVIVGNSLYPEHHLQEIEWAQRISECLERHYPGYLWAVNVDLHGGMTTIQSLRLSGEWGCYIPLRLVMNDPFLTKVKLYGGEILERYRMARGAFDEQQIANAKRDRLGNIMADHS